MNALYMWFVDRIDVAGPVAGIVVRMTLVLAFAWLVHAALVRANPRWRVLTWRVAAVALLLVPAVMLWGPAISLAILPASNPSLDAASQTTPVFESAPRDDLQSPNEKSAEDLQPTLHFEPSDTRASAGSTAMQEGARRMDWLGWSLAVWAIGVVFGLVGELAAWSQLRALRRRSEPVSSDMDALGRAIAAQLGYRRAIEIRRTCDLDSPCVAGILQPVILVPELDCQSKQRESLPAILSHEAAHLLGADLPWDGVLRVLGRLLWFHPLMWRARAAHLAACDAVCDATAANYLGDVTGYGRVLAQLALRFSASNMVPALHMARPSNVRLRIEALHRRLYSAGLARTVVTTSVAFGLLLASLCGAVSIARAVAAPEDGEGLSVSGRILNEQGNPIPEATVYVYSAGPRVGTSPYCPTCYIDCGKRTATGADGRFTIRRLNSTLVFQLLAVAEGHRPQFIKQVDPQQGASVEAKLVVRPIPKDPSHVVRGQVIDPYGRPTAGAVVESFGCKTAAKRWWGQMDGVDPLAVTDEHGEFVLVCDEPVIALDLKVEARGAVRKNFELVSSGNAKNRLELALGATVKGRVLDQGQPAAGVSIGICQKDRSAGKFLGPYQIDTDEEGRFTLANLPSDGELLVYGIMKTFKDRAGALMAKKFQPKEGAEIDLGDLSTVPAHTLSGRIALADGKPIPPHTRVQFSRDEAWDSNFVEATADGTFSINGIPPEVIGIVTRIKGYRLSPKNKSFETLNGFSIEGLVSSDVKELVILYEPGEAIRPDYERDWNVAVEKHNRLRTQPLAGVTAALQEFPTGKVTAGTAGKSASKPLPKVVVPPKEPAPIENGGAMRTLSGAVVDGRGQPIRNGRLWLPLQWISPFKTLTATGNVDASSQFRLTFPEKWLPSETMLRQGVVWTYVPGYAIGTGNAYQQLFGTGPTEPFKIEVPPAEDLSFVVLLPDGKPAVGAKVEPLNVNTSGAYYLVPPELAELVAGTTDAAGRVAMPALTRDGVFTINVKLAGYGTQQFRCEKKSTDPSEQKLQLRTVARIEGRIAVDQLELARDIVVSLETTPLRMDADLRHATGTAVVQVDEQGRFVIPEIADGRVEIFATCDERLPVRPRLPDRRNAVTLLTGETVTIEIPLELCVQVRGVVRAKDTQKPLAGVRVSVRYGAGRQGDHAMTNEQGEYTTFALAGEVYVHLISIPNGYLQLGSPWNERLTIPADAKEFTFPTIEVVPSMEIVGKLVDRDGKPMANVRINGVVGNRRYGFGTTDQNGAFKLPGVPTEIQLEKYQIWARDSVLTGVVVADEPLVIRVGN